MLRFCCGMGNGRGARFLYILTLNCVANPESWNIALDKILLNAFMEERATVLILLQVQFRTMKNVNILS